MHGVILRVAVAEAEVVLIIINVQWVSFVLMESVHFLEETVTMEGLAHQEQFADQMEHVNKHLENTKHNKLRRNLLCLVFQVILGKV